MTSIRDLLFSVILVGKVINCLRLDSDANLTNALLSGYFCSRLQFKYPSTMIGWLNVKARIRLGFNRSSKYDTGQSGGWYVAQTTIDLIFLCCTRIRSWWNPEVDVFDKSLKTFAFNGTLMWTPAPLPRFSSLSCLNNSYSFMLRWSYTKKLRFIPF